MANQQGNNDLFKQANAYIYDKLSEILMQKGKTDGSEKFKQTFDSEDIAKELRALYTQPKKALILALNKDSGIIAVGKDTRFVKKAVLILKTCKDDPLSIEMHHNFLFIEISKNTLEQMFIICKEIFYPMLSHSVYKGEGSELISKELVEKFHTFLANFYVCLGHIKGMTLLPVPSDEIFRNPKINDNEKTQICEGAVVMWIELIKHILKQEPEYDFRNSKNPNPVTEIDFWKKKSENLESIIKQIQGEPILEILKFLEKQKSSYYKFFNDIKKEVNQKAKESTQNFKFLVFLKDDLEEIVNESRQLPELAEFFIPIFHTIRLIWKDNEYYSKSERLIVLIRKLCNTMIDQAKLYIHSGIFGKINSDEENAEAIIKLETSREIISKFMNAYFLYKDAPGQDSWKITRNVIFYRLDTFNDRIGDILNVAKSYSEFIKIHQKNIGGIKGQSLQNILKDIFNECTQATKLFLVEDFDPLDISSDEFNKKYAKYKETLKELERRVAAVLTQTFDECDTIIGKFKILENFDTILERPNIIIELEKKYNNLLDLYKQELRTVQMLFLQGKEYIDKKDERSPLNKNMPPIAATLYWTDSLKERINEPFMRFISIGKRITDKEEFREIENLYHSIIKIINDYENTKKKNWDVLSKDSSGDKQKDFILISKGDLLSINFDPQLLQLLKEIKYLKILNLSIPEEADLVYQKNNIFRKQIASLENITSQFNSVILSLHDVEKPLIAEKLKKVQAILEPGFNEITWEDTKKIDDFVAKANLNINDLNSIVDKLHQFIKKIEDILKVDWMKNKMFKRPKLDEAEKIHTAFNAGFDNDKSQMSNKTKEFANLNEVNNTLKSAISNISAFKETDKWKNYQHYVTNIIINGFIEVIYSNLIHLYDCLDPNLEPFAIVRVVLWDRKLLFEPPLEDNNPDKFTVKKCILDFIDSFLNLACLYKSRLDIGSEGDYLLEVLENFRVQEIVYRIYSEVNELINETMLIIDSFKDLRVLWERDFNDSFAEFLKQYAVIPEENQEKIEIREKIQNIFPQGNPILKNVVEYTPNKEVFDDKINEFKNMLKRVKNMEKDQKIRWVQLDYTNFKNELEKIIENWIQEYKSFLWKNSKNKIENIKEFMKRVYTGINDIPPDTDNEKNRKKFIHLLEIIRDTNCLYPKILEIIPSIKGELEVLKKHSRNESDDDGLDNEDKEANSEEQKLINETDEIAKNIVSLFKNVEEVQQNINDLIEKESGKFKIQVKEFEQKVEQFRNDFNRNIPSKLESFSDNDINSAYKVLDNYYLEVEKLKQKKEENNNMEMLLNLNLSQNKAIQDCSNDLILYKNMWDYVALTYNTFENWKKIKMEKVDSNDLTDKIDLFKAMMRVPIRKEVKSIPVYSALNKQVINMEDTISVIRTLKEKAIKPRHWKHLMEVIGKNIPYDQPEFSVDSLIQLEMFKFKDKCDEEKQIAVDQNKIEDQYNGIYKQWQGEKFRMTKSLNNKDYDFFLFDHSQMEVVIEQLEKHQIALIQMVQKKTTLENFEGMGEKINGTLEKLKVVNDVIKLWLKFQKNWEKLETIFLNADDIRKTLNEHYLKFKELDSKFKDEMKIAYDYNTMIDVCTPERKMTLIEMSAVIAECEQALDNYLAEKKKLFPRFYFLSNDTLLNMLSYGEYPNIINKNVKDCFDGIKFWAMTPLNEKNKSDTVLGMLSADNDEVVMFDQPFICTGLVESYLSKFESRMRNTLKEILIKSRGCVEWSTMQIKDKKPQNPRQQWLNPFPAQIALLVTNNIWTDEVEHAFDELEGGADGAMREYLEESKKRISALITRVRDDPLNRDLRVKIITIITVDVHARDVVEYIVEKKIADQNNFHWRKQLRFKWGAEKKEMHAIVADYVEEYSYEYIGNTGRLVITPLTDRCYITLTQALNLVLGGAPAGPAGTGKTETTKDLGRNLGLGVIVNNCSDQMDIDTTARILGGLAQTGFWGCFDEFNRISIEVLSVVATQVKTILDSMRQKVTMFNFDNSDIRLVKTVGFFITMNPGYAGRTELPDNLKALFRSCAMVVPDLMLICENMLMSEGFEDAKVIAKKFITLYYLSRDLLSKQKHYDWGLRAIKSLLRQAGALKRHPLNKSKAEQTIIMKALWDFNKAKIVLDDLPIFRRLLEDLFKESSGSEIMKEDDEVNKIINQMIETATEHKDVNLQKDVSFTTKTRQLYEILEVRHCCFVMGPPGCGKSAVWKTLFGAMSLKECYGLESAFDKLSPKAINVDELYGYFDKNKSWHYGILSSIMKKMCKNDPPYKDSMKKKWIILDGDIDPDWIESLNTVMDDNKVLTLNNGDRFPLDEFMRLLFEISNLRNATPATASRGGCLYINDIDIGIRPFFDKWVKTKYSNQKYEVVRSVVNVLFKETFDKIKGEFKEKHISPIVEMNSLQNVCTLFQHLIDKNIEEINNVGDDDRKKLIVEGIYFFAFMWGAGGSLKDRKDMINIINHSINKKLRLPDQGSCFDYFFDIKNNWVNWSTQLKNYEIPEGSLFQNIIIPNVEVLRLNRIIKFCMLEDKPVLFIGDAGTGKTAVVKNFLNSIPDLNNDMTSNNGYTYKSYIINFNSFTDSYNFQNTFEAQISQRFGNRFGPLGTTKLIYFLDDLNMPGMDKYGTQTHVELLTQIMNYKEVYDRKDLDQKKILEDLLFIACQNPKAGSFVVDSRLQRHFTVLCTSEPSQEVINDIYLTILSNHYKTFKLKGSDSIDKICKDIMFATSAILEGVRTQNRCFNPSASKFHYQWNLREIAKLVEGMLRTNNTFYKDPDQLYRLWFHECNRVFRDRLILTEDIKTFDKVLMNIFDQNLRYSSPTKTEDLIEPFILVPFDDAIDEGENILIQPKDFNTLKEYINNKLEEYNEVKSNMPLVLFDDAIMHICRIARIISNPSSHALLVGVGGSGKQSLSRLAAFIKSTQVFSINLAGEYNREKLLEDLRSIVRLSCIRPTPVQYIFMLNDNHILEEYFLVYINSFLASSWVDQMYENKQDLDQDIQKIKTQAISDGFMKATEYNPDQIFEYLLYRIKINFHFIICMSPVGDTLRVRARKFPGILTCTSIDWFHEWPDDALEKVAKRKISELEIYEDNENLIQVLSLTTTELHKSLKVSNENYYKSERRFNYTTPKSYLELLDFFKLIVKLKDDEVEKQLVRLEKGLSIVKQTSEYVANLKIEITEATVRVNIEKEKTNKILEVLVVEQAKIEKENEIVSAATERALAESEKAEKEMKEANAALAEAEPIKQKALEEAGAIDANKLNEFKNQNKPSDNAIEIFKLVYLIFFPNEKTVPDINVIKSKCLNQDAKAIKEKLKDKLFQPLDWINEQFLVKVDKYLKPPFNDETFVKNISLAAWGVAGFFGNLIKYKRAYDFVNPIIIKANEAKGASERANEEKRIYVEKLESVLAIKREIEESYEKSKAEKEAVEAEKQLLDNKLEVAENFIGLLAGNNQRWKEEVARLKDFKSRISGDCLLASAFVSYIGVFNSFFRAKIIKDWKAIVTAKNISITNDLEIIKILITEAEKLKFKAEGLPADPFSTENSAIIKWCTRWPLIIDPQMQCIKWLKGMSVQKSNVQFKQHGWDRMVGENIESGTMLIMEDVDQELSPILTPLLGKETYKKDKSSKSSFIKIGSSEFQYNNNFKIYFITKITNPHYKPEIIAQCTLINFIVTEKGLEDQLLAMVVNIEQPELEEMIKKYIDEINEFQRELIQKEDDVLRKLGEADQETILENVELIKSLESTKSRAMEIEEKSTKTVELIKDINIKREAYRKVGEEGAMLYFLISKLFVVQYMYQYSLDSFNYFFTKAINGTEKSDKLETRIVHLRETIRVVIYLWVTSGMFEKDKQLFLTMIALRLIQKGALTHEDILGIKQSHIDFLLRCPRKQDAPPRDNQMGFLDEFIWQSMCHLQDLDGFAEFAVKMEKEQCPKFREWFNEINPEDIPLPLDWKKHKKHSFYKLLVLRCCRPDRVSVALNEFFRVCLPRGNEFMESRTFSDILSQAFNDSTTEIPIFFILSPGSNPVKELEVLGRKVNPKKKYELNKTLHQISMGQKMDEKAEAYLATCSTDGHWLFLQNIHLMPKWLKKLEDKLKDMSKDKAGSEDFRLFLSAEPRNEIPVGLLEKCIKLTNEPPSGLKENMKIAFNTLKTENPNIDDRRRCNVIFGLCYFHSVILERKKFGSLGWNRSYPFNLDDLRNSDMVVAKYLETNPGMKIPWDDLRYIVGEIMYGGHIVDDWDRRLNSAYLEYLLVDKINEDLDMIPYVTANSQVKLSLKTPANNAAYPFEKWAEYIDNFVTTESPALFGLHPNAELDFRVQQAESLFTNLIDLEPKDSSGGTGEESEQSKLER